MSEVDARLNRGELQALLAAIDCLVNGRHESELPVVWWKGEGHDRATLRGLRKRFQEELMLLE